MFSTHTPATGEATTVLESYLNELEERSDGRLQFELYTDASLVASSEILDAIDTGLADCGVVNYGLTNGTLNLAGVTALPGIFQDSWAANRALMDVATSGGALTEQLSENGVVCIGTFFGEGNIIISKTPVEDITDLSGLKVISSTDTLSRIVEEVGGTVVGFSNSETYEAFSKNTADATVNSSFVSATTFALEEVAHYAYDLNLGCGPLLYCMNEDKWNELPEDLQQIFLETMQDYLADVTYQLYVLKEDQEETSKEKFINAGGTVVEPTDEQIESFTSTYAEEQWAIWVEEREAEGYDGQAVIDEFTEAYALYEGENPYAE